MRYIRPSLVVTGICTLFASAAMADSDLAAVFARIDKAAPLFHGFSADIRRATHTPVVPDEDVQTGRIVVRLAKAHDLQLRIDIDPPEQQQMGLDGQKVEIYYPKTNSVQQYALGRFRSLADQVLTLGWGSTSRDLLSAYQITYGGEDDTTAGQKAAKLILVPKDKDLLKEAPKFELWISEEPATSGIATQLKIYQRGGDYNLATYTNMKLRSPSESDVKLSYPKNAQKLKSGK